MDFKRFNLGDHIPKVIQQIFYTKEDLPPEIEGKCHTGFEKNNHPQHKALIRPTDNLQSRPTLRSRLKPPHSNV